MSSLQNQQIKLTYKDVVQLNQAGAGVSASLSAMADGNGTILPTKISTSQFGVDNLVFDESAITVSSGTLTLSGLSITPSTGTLTVTNGKTLAVSNTLTLSGTDGSTVNYGAGGTVAYTGGHLGQFAATTSAQLAGVISDETGSGALVFGTSPTIATPTITGNITATLDQFAATTSAQLKSVISDETGIGPLVFAQTPTLTSPTLTDPVIEGNLEVDSLNGLF